MQGYIFHIWAMLNEHTLFCDCVILCVFSSFRVVLAFMAHTAPVLFLDLFLHLDYSGLQYTRTHKWMYPGGTMSVYMYVFSIILQLRGTETDKWESSRWKCVYSMCLFPFTLKGGFQSDAIEELFWVPKRNFQWKEYFVSVKNILIIWITFFHYKEPFVEWKSSMDVKCSSYCRTTNVNNKPFLKSVCKGIVTTVTPFLYKISFDPIYFLNLFSWSYCEWFNSACSSKSKKRSLWNFIQIVKNDFPFFSFPFFFLLCGLMDNICQ